MNIVNFGHPFSEEALSQLRKLGKEELKIQSIKVSIELHQDLEAQVSKLVDQISFPLDGTEPLTLVPPGLSVISAMLMAEIHGRTGVFPRVIHLVRDNERGVFVISQIVDLEWMRQKSRGKRK